MKLRENEKQLSAKKSETELANFATRTLDFLMSHYGHAWKQGRELVNVETQLRCWMASMAGLTQDQVDYAKQKITSGECYTEYPPNPGQFRLLCNSRPEYFKAKPRVTVAGEKTPSATATFNPDYDISWFCELTPEGKTKVYEGALKAYPVLEGMLKISKESFLDVGFEKSCWFKPMTEAFRGYYRLEDVKY